jgi:hypothetical protein
VPNFAIAALLDGTFKFRALAKIETFRFSTRSADDVMMMVSRVGLKFVSSDPVAKVTSAYQADLLESGDTAIDGHKIQTVLLEGVEDLLGAVGAVLLDQKAEQGFPGLGPSQACRLHQLECAFESFTHKLR